MRKIIPVRECIKQRIIRQLGVPKEFLNKEAGKLSATVRQHYRIVKEQ